MKKIIERIQWEHLDDLLLFLFLGGLYWTAIYYGMADLAKNIGMTIVGAACMWLKGRGVNNNDSNNAKEN